MHKTQGEDRQNKKHSIICIEHYYTQANTNNVDKTWTFLQTTGGKDEPNNPPQAFQILKHEVNYYYLLNFVSLGLMIVTCFISLSKFV